jgi:hypothetical protein
MARQSPQKGSGKQLVTEAEKSVPVHSIRLRHIRASIWKNKTKTGPQYAVTVRRFWCNAGQWQYSNTFNRDDLLVVGEILRQCFTWICEIEQSQEKNVP